jgi:RND family efflux transporter MFP subunit
MNPELMTNLSSQVNTSTTLLTPVLAMILGASLLTGCGEKTGPSRETRPALPVAQVKTQSLEAKKHPSIEEVVGTVRAKLSATLEAKLSGRIEQMPVVLGQRVKSGQLVARLDAAEIKARLEQAKAALDQVERDWKRVSSLFAANAATRSEYDATEARRRVAQATVAEAEAMMAYVEVLAPFDGVVSRKRADVGDLATPGKPLLDLEDPSALQLEAYVPETLAPRIQAGARLDVSIDSVAGITSGTVAEVAPAADPASRTFRVKLDLPPAQGCMSGQFGRVGVPTGEAVSLRVPWSAVVERGQMEIVFVIRDQHAQMHLVKTGRRFGDLVEILSGLDAGDVVVVEGAAGLTDGQPVESK